MTASDVRRFDWRRGVLIAGLLLLATLLLVDLARLGISMTRALGYAYELDYGEGIVWQQMANIVAGHGYAPLGVFPAIVYHYPPVYHLATAALIAVTGLDPLLAGRLLSAIGTLTTFVAIGWLAMAAMPRGIGRRAAVTGAVLGAVSFAGSTTLMTWSAMMRVDMLASALTMGGLLLAATAGGRTGRLIVAAAVSALAVYTKQTAIAGPIAIFIALMIARPRSAWVFAVWCGGFGVAALIALTIVTDGQFLQHVLLYNVNRYDPKHVAFLIGIVVTQAMTFALCAIGAALAARQLRLRDWRGLRDRLDGSKRDFAAAMALIYLSIRLAGLAMIMKSGASDNYLIDLYAIMAVFVGFCIASIVAAVVEHAHAPRPIVAVLVLIGLPIQLYSVGSAFRYTGDRDLRSANAAVVERIRNADRPVISDDMVLLRRADKPVLFEPAIAAELGHAGRYDEAAFVGMVRRGDFALFITRGVRGERLFDERYNPAVADAIDAAYPRIEQVGDLTLHLPR